MRIAILETGRINAEIADRFARYPDMFRTMFDGATQQGAGQHGMKFVEVPVVDGVIPDDVDDYDGYLVTGSAAGVYDEFDWIAPLMAFLRTAHAADKPLVGICFGHQVIAHALGDGPRTGMMAGVLASMTLLSLIGRPGCRTQTQSA